jgi:hypothetical protein
LINISRFIDHRERKNENKVLTDMTETLVPQNESLINPVSSSATPHKNKLLEWTQTRGIPEPLYWIRETKNTGMGTLYSAMVHVHNHDMRGPVRTNALEAEDAVAQRALEEIEKKWLVAF